MQGYDTVIEELKLKHYQQTALKISELVAELTDVNRIAQSSLFTDENSCTQIVAELNLKRDLLKDILEENPSIWPDIPHCPLL